MTVLINQLLVGVSFQCYLFLYPQVYQNTDLFHIYFYSSSIT